MGHDQPVQFASINLIVAKFKYRLKVNDINYEAGLISFSLDPHINSQSIKINSP